MKIPYLLLFILSLILFIVVRNKETQVRRSEHPGKGNADGGGLRKKVQQSITTEKTEKRLIIGICSTPQRKNHRQASRETWIQDKYSTLTVGIKVEVFFIFGSKNSYTDKENTELETESESYGGVMLRKIKSCRYCESSNVGSLQKYAN